MLIIMGIFKDLAKELTEEAKECLSCEQTRRKPYKRGCKAFLSMLEMWQKVVVDDTMFRWRNMQSVGAVMKREFGCEFRFHTDYHTKQKTVMRLA